MASKSLKFDWWFHIWFWIFGTKWKCFTTIIHVKNITKINYEIVKHYYKEYVLYTIKLAEIIPHPAELPRELLELRTKLQNSEIL